MFAREQKQMREVDSHLLPKAPDSQKGKDTIRTTGSINVHMAGWPRPICIRFSMSLWAHAGDEGAKPPECQSPPTVPGGGTG